jgi:hypothetical protein
MLLNSRKYLINQFLTDEEKHPKLIQEYQDAQQEEYYRANEVGFFL